MNGLTRTELVLRLIRWRLGWNKRDIDFKPKGLNNPKFMSARQAMALIPDEAVVMTGGRVYTPGHRSCTGHWRTTLRPPVTR